MNENIQQQILDELKSISANLSIQTVPEYKFTNPIFAQTLFDHIITMEQNVENMFRRLQRIEEMLNKK